MARSVGPIEYGSGPFSGFGPIPSPWASGDIGSVGVAGSDGYTSGSWQIVGSGTDVFGTSDSFRYVYRQLTGDFDIAIRVASLTNTSAYAKAGLMARDTLAVDSAHAHIAVEPGGQIEATGRSVSGGSSTLDGYLDPATDRYIRLVRSGSTISRYRSANGSTWTPLGTNQTRTLPATMYVGFFVCAQNNTVTADGRFDSLALSQTLPAGYTGADIGSVGFAGSNSYLDGAWTISGSGADVWGSVDAFRYVYRSVSGDFDIRAKVTGLTNTGTYAKAGLMIRASTAANAAFATINLNPAHFIETDSRASTGATATYDGGVDTTSQWVRLVRTGTVISRYYSDTGAAGSWVHLGTDQSPTIPVDALVGPFVCAQNNAATAVGTFESVGFSSSYTVASGVSAGTSAVTATSAFRKSVYGAGSASGSSAATAVSKRVIPAVGTAGGTTLAVNGVSETDAYSRADGSSAGTSTAAGHGAAVKPAIGVSSGVSPVIGRGQSIVGAIGTASGTSDATAIPFGVVREAVGTASGTSTVDGIGAYIDLGNPDDQTLETARLRKYRIKQSDSLRSIALRLYRDATRWTEIARINDLRPPHIIDSLNARDRLPHTVIWGDVILVPVAAIEDDPAPESLFGFDVELSNTGEVVITNGDLETVSGTDNLRQAIRHRIKTLTGELLYHPRYGCNVQLALGLQAEPVIRLMGAAWVHESLRQETRLASIQGVDATVSGDRFDVVARVTAVGSNSPVDINIVTP